MRISRFFVPPILRGLAGVMLMMWGMAPAWAQTSWNVPSGDWNVAGNWTGSIPQFNNAFISNGGTATLPTSVSGTAFNLYIGGTSSGGSGTLLITGGTLRAIGSLYAGQAAGSTGTIRITSGTFGNNSPNYIGYDGTGSLSLEGGYFGSNFNTSFRLSAGEGIGSVGDISITGGTMDFKYGTLTVGKSGNATLLLNGGVIANNFSTVVGQDVNSSGLVTVTSGSWTTSAYMTLGLRGSGTAVINGGNVSANAATLGDVAGGFGSLTVASGSMIGAGGALTIGAAGTGVAAISGGYVSYANGNIGNAAGGAGSLTATSGSLRITGNLGVGVLGTGTMTINGGNVTSGSAAISSGTSGRGTVLVSSGTWTNTGSMTIGALGSSGTLTVQSGGRITTGQTVVGTGTSTNAAFGGSNTIIVTGSNARFEDADSLVIGSYGSGNTVVVSDGALFMIGDTNGETLSFSTGTGTDNFLRINWGYVALFGDQVSEVNSLIAGGNFQIWDGSGWEVSTDLSDFDVAYYDTNAAANTFSGYDGLGGYTIVTAIPEPATWAMLALAAGVIAWRRRLARERTH